MPSYIGRPKSLTRTGACIRMQLAVPYYVTAESNVMVPPIEATGVIDTGALSTLIQEDVATRLGLPLAGMTAITTATDRDVECRQYHVRLLFPQGTAIDVLAVAVDWPQKDVQCLIGRDVLKHGLLIYNGLTNMFSLIF